MDIYYEGFIITLLKKDLNDYFMNLDGFEEKDQEIINEYITEYFDTTKLVFKKKEEIDYKENKTHIYRDRLKYSNRPNKCLARIWNCGMGGQCSFTGKYNGFCKKHSLKGNDWWLGTVDLPRPERPINHKDKVHIWLN